MKDETFDKNKIGITPCIILSLILLLFFIMIYDAHLQDKEIKKTCENFGGEIRSSGCVKDGLYYKIVIINEDCFLDCKYKIVKYATGESP